MAEVKLKFTKQFFIDLLTINSESFYIKLADLVKVRIQSHTRSGKSLVDGKKLKPLSAKYIEQRRTPAFAAKADSDYFAPSRSNLTATGEMLKSLKSQIYPSLQKFIVRAEGLRKDGEDNSDIAKYAAKGGRPFMGLDPIGIKRVTTEVKRELRRMLKRFK